MKQPDIVFIVLDTQRADRLGCYGHRVGADGESVSPNLDKFAREGALFEAAISPAQWTIPSHASMFTGLYPSAHKVTQSNQALGKDAPHIVEMLHEAGYRTIGFCNNPLVGVLDNGFKRGFDSFYNYGGAIPSLPKHSTKLPWPLNWMLETYTQFLRRISYPIQNFFGRSDLAFRISLNVWLTPLWSRIANFKGQNARSVRDILHMLRVRESSEEEQPLFLFVNLMETHLPFWPPGEYVDRIVPYMRSNREARNILRRWNREAYRWSTPLAEPLEELEHSVLSDMYDAEVAYQDDYLGPFFELLNQRGKADNTLTIIVSDHGDGIGEHGYFGHAFNAYQELIHVPLVVHWPEKIKQGLRSESAVSTRRIYHTIADAAGVEFDDVANPLADDVARLTLLRSLNNTDPEDSTVFAEIYPPLNLAKAIQHRQPDLLERFRCLDTRRAVLKDKLKLIQVSDVSDELFDLDDDTLELANLLNDQPQEVDELSERLEKLARITEIQSEMLEEGEYLDIDSDEGLVHRLRGLGYIE
jgi:uncharacterized sulfatase